MLEKLRWRCRTRTNYGHVVFWHWYLVHGKDFYEVITDQKKKGVWYLFKNRNLWFGIALSAVDGQRRCEEEARNPKLRSRNLREYWKKTLDTIPHTMYNLADQSKSGVSRVAYRILTNDEPPENVSEGELKEKVMAVLTKSKPAAPANRGPAARPAAATAPAARPAAKTNPAAPPQAQRGAVAAAPAKAAPEQKTPKPPKQQISATQEEIEAAINGTLQPREVKGTKAQDGLGGSVNSAGKPIGRPIGLTTGLPIQMAWIYQLWQNEARAAEGKPWTDEQLSAWMKKEFPGRPNKTFDSVQACRANINKGQATRGIPIGGVESPTPFNRYNADGTVYVPKRAFGRPAVEEAPAEEKAPAAAPVKKSVLKKVVKA